MGTRRVEELLELRSGDFDGARVGDVLPLMVKRYLSHAECPHGSEWPGSDCNWLRCQAHASEIEHGGPVTYVLRLARDMRARGWDGDPVEAGKDTLWDGHHRTLAAALAGLEEIPVDLD